MHRTSVLLAGLGAAVCVATPAIAAKAPRVQDRLDALERALAAQQARIERQDQVIEAQQAEIARLRGAAAVQSPVPGAEAQAAQAAQIATLQEDADRQKLVDAERPRVSFPGGRPTVTSPDGRYSIALRATVQLDAAKYFQDDEGPLANDFASSASSPAAVRRGRRGSTTLGSATPASRRSPSRSAPIRRRPTWTTARALRTPCSSSGPRPPSSRAPWAGRMGA
jgi:hypothetical protein